MLFLLFKLAFLKEYRNKYPSRLSWVGQWISELVLLTVYWYTAKSFVPNLEVLNNDTNYFSYILIGETILFVPALMMSVFTRIFRSEVQQGTFEPTLISVSGLPTSWLVQGLAIVAVEALRLIVVFALVIFAFQIGFAPPTHLTLVIMLVILALPFFAGLGLLGASIMIHFGRGERVVPLVATMMSIFAGAYFPPEALPHGLYVFTSQLSPMSILLMTSRRVLETGWQTPDLVLSAGYLITASLVFLLVGTASLNFSVRMYRRRSQPLLVLS